MAVDRDLREFKDQLTVLLIGLLFIMLAADVRIEHVLDLGWAGVGVTVGEGAVVGARSVAVRDVEPWQIVVGNPAKSIKKRVFSPYD